MRIMFLLLLLYCTLTGKAQWDTTFLPKPQGLVQAATLAEVGISNPLAFQKTDDFIQQAIAAGAFPGCRVLAAKDGLIFYDRAFGYLTYEKKQPVTRETIYDLASVTKVLSTTLAVMRLYEQKKLDLDATLGKYLPMTVGTDKAGLKIKDLLLHQAGLKAWIPFYKSMYDSTGYMLLDTAFAARKIGPYTQQVAKGLYMRKDYRDTIWQAILTSPLENKGRMVYSDLDFYFIAAVVEAVTGKSIDRYVSDEFYVPMGLRDIGYNPLQWTKKDRIAPTENDLSFRLQLLQGYVHDPGAALFGGIAGHAGLFSTAQDAAALMQLLMDGGTYRGKRYFKLKTVKLFTAYASALSRRGLGWDKPAADDTDAGPAGNNVSGWAFGHQGFTGTCVWADPQSRVVFIFLSNRVYPDQENGLINRLGVRTVVQDYLYEALGIPKNTQRVKSKEQQLLNYLTY